MGQRAAPDTSETVDADGDGHAPDPVPQEMPLSRYTAGAPVQKAQKRRFFRVLSQTCRVRANKSQALP
jgi:hypothetical protein